MMKPMALVLLLITAASAAGCRVLTSADGCTAEYPPALSVRVQDSVSGLMIASGAQLVVRDGSYADSASFPANRPDLDALALAAAGERAGTYTVTVRKAGYRDWVKSSVTATKGECHVNTVSLRALLQRLP